MDCLSIDALSVEVAGRSCVRDVAFALHTGELFALIGPNGAGKSTLLKALAQLIPHQGQVALHGASLGAMSPRERAVRLAFLAQGDQVVWPLRVRDFVALGRLPHQRGWGARPTAEDAAAVDGALAAMQLQALAQRHLNELSGGERARVRLARALAVQAPVLLADEPVAALDPYHQLRVMELLRAQCDAGRSVIVVLHDLTLASRFCDRVLLLHAGHTVACGPPRHVLTPGHLQRVYQVQAMHGEHQRQGYVVPWSCHTSPQNAC